MILAKRVGTLTLALVLLTACMAVAPGGFAHEPSGVEPPAVKSVRDLVMLAREAGFEEVAALFGPLPDDDAPAYVEKGGPFPTGRSVFISHVSFSRSGGQWSIAVSLLRPHQVGCFEMKDLPEMVGATKARRPSHSESDYFRVVGPRLSTEFKSFPGRFSYMCLDTITFRERE